MCLIYSDLKCSLQNTVRYFAMYGTCTVFMVRANASIPHVMRIIDFTRFYFLIQSSLAFTIARGCPRSSAAARISRPSTTVAPTLQASTHLAPTITFFFLFYSDKMHSRIRFASWSPCRRRRPRHKQSQHYFEVFLFSKARIVFQICILKQKMCLFMC